MSDGDAPQRAIALFAFTPAEKDAQLKLALKKGASCAVPPSAFFFSFFFFLSLSLLAFFFLFLCF